MSRSPGGGQYIKVLTRKEHFVLKTKVTTEISTLFSIRKCLIDENLKIYSKFELAAPYPFFSVF